MTEYVGPAPRTTTEGTKPLTAFEERFLSKLGQVDSQEIERFLTDVARERQFLQIVFNALADGVIVLKDSLEVQFLNNAAVDLLGLNTHQRVLGQRLAPMVPIDGFREILARFALLRERVVSQELEASHRDPSHWLSISILPLKEGGHAGAIVLVHDVTEVRKAAEERRKAERAATLSTLAAGLAHEIKNPLNSLQIHAQLLQRALRDLPVSRKKGSPDRDRMQQSSQVIVDEIQRLNSKLEEFLAATRPTRPTFASVSIPRLIHRVLDTMRPEADALGIQLLANIEPDMPDVAADSNQLMQATLNLVKNAMEALRPADCAKTEVATNQAPPVVKITADAAGLHWRLRVWDNGPGIPAADMPMVFQPYYTTKARGTGLGLSIVSRIVEEHGGTMDLASVPGGGTVVTLAFPLHDRVVRKIEGAK